MEKCNKGVLYIPAESMSPGITMTAVRVHDSGSRRERGTVLTEESQTTVHSMGERGRWRIYRELKKGKKGRWCILSCVKGLSSQYLYFHVTMSSRQISGCMVNFVEVR